VQILPLVLSALAALAVGPGLRRTLIEGGHTVANYRGQQLPTPLGIIIVTAAALAFGGLAVLYELDITDQVPALGGAFVFGVAVFGVFDDAYSGESRGWRGHGDALRTGAIPTGALKAIGTLGLAAWYAYGSEPHDFLRYVLVVLILVLSTNLFNIIDLRPGRAVKTFLILAIALTIAPDGAELLKGFGAFVGAILVVGLYDLREQGMLGDTGANVIGAVAGLWLVSSISSTSGLVITVVVLAAITAYGEFRSISAFIERTPGLRHLDSVGRIQTRKDAAE
jgi:UDP-N-acetylmuramyl pentapeptide phosphotransferase/UDP-N-acetylglucosamine-1-phosphate transferase